MLHLLLLFGVFTAGVLQASCGGTKSLTFVIDDTRSMGDDIRQVRREVDGIMDVVYKTNEISDIVLITFNDPSVQVKKKTRDRDELKRALSNIRVHNYYNYDCPEYSLSGIELALYESKAGSYIYVFTDASAKDYRKVDKIKDLCQKTQSQVIFVLTGDCHRPNNRNYQVYYEVATASSGLVIEVDKDEVNMVVKTIGTFIEGKISPITSVVIPPHTASEVPFTVDDKTQSVIISTTGKNVHMSILGPVKNPEKIMWTKNCKMMRLNDPEPGNYTIHVTGASSTYAVVYGRTDFTFQHGFSQTVPKIINDTARQPIANEPNYLTISVNDTDDSVRIETAQILTMDEKVVTHELPLKELKDDFYITEPFVSPERMFKIAVNGRIIKSGQPIRRIAKTPIEPQIVERPDPKKPRVTITEAPKYTAIYGSAVILTCKVHAYPPPDIIWKDGNGNALLTNSSLLEKPYDFISYLHLNNLTRAESYTCHAINKLGRDAKDVFVDIGDPFKVISKPEETTLAKYLGSKSIKCIIKSESKMKINWYYKNGIHTEKLHTDDKYTISPDGTELLIKSMNKDLIGKYTCNAALVNDDYIHKKFSTDVEMYGYEAPYISKSTSYLNVQEGSSVTIPCTIQKGIPKPRVEWQSESPSFNSTRVTVGDDGFHILQARLRDSGKYKCIAVNDAGTDQHVTTLVIYSKPVVNIVQGSKINLNYSDSVKIECNATGYPLPTLTWRHENGTEILNNSIHSSTNQFTQRDVLELKHVKKSMKLYCNSKNTQGEESQAIQVNVPNAFIVIRHPEDTTDASYGKEVNIVCDIKSVMPMKITWYLLNETTGEKVMILPSSKYSLVSNGAILKIPFMDLDLVGKYTCEAALLSDENEKKSFDTTLQLRGLKKPNIELPTDVKVTGNPPTEIECRILEGFPKPKISWQFQKRDTHEFKPIPATDTILRLSNVSLDDIGNYKCIASNYLGQAEKITAVTVEIAPKLTIVEGKKLDVPYGANITLTCRVVAYPAPSILWADNEGIEILPVEKPAENNAHLYDFGVALSHVKKSSRLNCYATNIHGEASETTDIIVESPFNVTEKPEAIVSVDYSKPHTIKCHITSPLKMQIQWYRVPETKGKRLLIRSSEKYSINPDGTELTIKSMDLGLNGRYQCKASLIDDHTESIYYNTNIKISGLAPPEINKNTTVIKLKQGSNGVIPCSLLKGSPRPDIKWFYKSDPDSDLQPVDRAGGQLSLPEIQPNHAGHYLCTAENIRGKDQHYTEVIVEAPPKIILNMDKTAYYAVVGDVVLKIPCNATGFPKPNITWQVNEREITPDSKYSIVDDALIVHKPEENDTLEYTCIAKNIYGEDNATFDGVVTNELVDYENIHYINVLEGTSKKINCLVPRSGNDSLRWFLNENAMNTTAPYIQLVNSDVSMDGNYSCRVSNERGYSMETYIVNVGFPPRFKSYQDDPMVDWDGEGQLDCDTDAVPEATVQWFYEGIPMKTNDDNSQLPINKWGQYKCIVKNVHGSDQRTFNVTSSDCLINRRGNSDKNPPLILTENLKWPQFTTKKDLLLIPHQENLIFSCHGQDDSPNSLTILPGRSEVQATCAGTDKFYIDGKLYPYSDLHCEHEVKPIVKRTGEQCVYNDTELIQVGYGIEDFVEVYTVCFDTKNNVPLYSQVRMTDVNNLVSPPDAKWFNPLNISTESNNVYTCEKSSKSCCISKEQLVSGNDVTFGPARRSTFIEHLNSIPAWTHCDSSNSSRITWPGVEDLVRSQYITTPEFAVWSGAAKYNNKDGKNIPEYLWKVMRFDETTSLAIIYINDPHPTDSQVLCTDVCASGKVSWIKTNDKYTYCCDLDEFLTAFHIPEEIVGGL